MIQDMINWKIITDDGFVYLTSDLLRRLGFTDIQIQGDGPDGGIDIFATEKIPFAIQGHRSFRWGIQCKFSINSKQKSVNDKEVYDVEGILRSDRYASQNMNGYMLVTNRRVTQNVTERLRGVEKQTLFKTSILDYFLLENLLKQNNELLEKYFGIAKLSIKEYGEPSVILHAVDNKHYQINVEISSASLPNKWLSIVGLIDTGAELSVIQPKLIDQLNLRQTGIVSVTAASHQINVPIYSFDIKIGKNIFHNIQVIRGNLSGLGDDAILIGQNLLNHMVLLLDGQNHIIKIWH